MLWVVQAERHHFFRVILFLNHILCRNERIYPCLCLFRAGRVTVQRLIMKRQTNMPLKHPGTERVGRGTDQKMIRVFMG